MDPKKDRSAALDAEGTLKRNQYDSDKKNPCTRQKGRTAESVEVDLVARASPRERSFAFRAPPHASSLSCRASYSAQTCLVYCIDMAIVNVITEIFT